MTQDEVDEILHEVINEHKHKLRFAKPNPARDFGMVVKRFHEKVDKTRIDGELVRERAESILGFSRKKKTKETM